MLVHLEMGHRSLGLVSRPDLEKVNSYFDRLFKSKQLRADPRCFIYLNQVVIKAPHAKYVLIFQGQTQMVQSRVEQETPRPKHQIRRI